MSKLILKEFINSKINTELKRISFQLYQSKYGKYDISRESPTKIFYKIIKEDSLEFLINTLPYITSETTRNRIFIESNDDIRICDRMQIFSSIDLEEYRRLLNVNLNDYGIDIKGEEELVKSNSYEFNIKLDINDYSEFGSKVNLVGMFEGDCSNIIWIDQEWDFISILDVDGIRNDIDVPSWCEYLIDGCLDIYRKNNKMAFFNLFAALDNLINVIHEGIFEYYLNMCIRCGIQEVFKEKIRCFSNKTKNLNLKLTDVMKELKLDIKDFETLKSWKKYSEVRDKIAHGGTYEDKHDINEVAYTIIMLIYSLILQKNVEKTEWEDILEF
ncbi:hypothetical protein GKZ28_11020 [Clostridium chromiireducens]|uniref:Uncharacterized protein n=1 Tax=Clostridium chromiireducens TaxID=225345 RepID=A0A964W279_9CLOT|nr:hypothetical protein [Clostridium chromiireducens]MVX64221.1 hypothetical protein [Clostridium chromiireducens]